MVAFVLARAVLRKFGSDNFSEIKEGVSRHRKWCEAQGVAGRSMTKQDEDVPEMEME
jgi:hypothetical protein